jgi:2-oxoglutarate ferredoxin oxidoreductase subunit delta
MMGKDATTEAKKSKTFKLRIREDLCKGCQLCVAYCPKDCLAMTTDRLNAKGVPFCQFVRPENCVGCKACVTVCPDAVLELFSEDEESNG